ncbi:MAG: hypothetical protein ACRDPK_12250 [Carbonactinosporaceae bacterium]
MRRAITTRLEPVLDEEPTSGEAAADAAKAWRLYWSGSYSLLASVLADAIPAARAVSGGFAALAELYECAACLLVHVGREDLSFLATEKAARRLGQTDDELFHAAQHGSLAWVHLEATHYQGAVSAAVSMARQIEARLGSADPRHVSVWGSLLLSAATAEARRGGRVAADDYLNLAEAAAARLGEERNDLQTHVGRRHIIRTPVVHYARHLLDVAQAQALDYRSREAAETLLRAERLAPEWIRHQDLAGAVVRELLPRPRLPRLRPLARRLGVDV